MRNGGYIDGVYVSWLGTHAVLFDKMERQQAEYLQAEYRYRLKERLGILCGADEPTPEQMRTAKLEADTWFKENCK